MSILALLLSVLLLTCCQRTQVTPPAQSQLLPGAVSSGEEAGEKVSEKANEKASQEACQEPNQETNQESEQETSQEASPYYPRVVQIEWEDLTRRFCSEMPLDYREWPRTDGRIEIRPGLWLVIRKYGLYDTIYFLEQGTKGLMLAALINNAELELVTSDVISLRCYTSADGFRSFPTRTTYYVDNDELIEDYLYWDCTEPFRFNFYYTGWGGRSEPLRLEGHEVLDIEADDNTVTILFSPWPEDPYLKRLPETITTFEESTCTFNLLFVGSKVSQDVIDKAEALDTSAICRSLSLSQTTEGVHLGIKLKEPMQYRTSSSGEFSMTVWFKNK